MKEKIDRLMERYGFKTRPFKHQAREFLRHRKDEARAMLWSMRTGKSKSIIDLACYNFDRGVIDGVLVVAPNGVHENWPLKQIPEHHWDMPYRTITWRMADMISAPYSRGWFGHFERFVMEKDKLFWFAVNSEALVNPKTRKIIKKFLKHRRFLLVVDESDDFKTPGSKRTQMMKAVKRRAKMKRIMSGTTTLESPLDAYSQYEMLEDGCLGFETYAEFEKKYAVYEMEKTKGGREYPVLTDYKNLKHLRKRMAQWSSVVLREDCEDLPQLMYIDRYIVPTAAQLKIYKKLHHEFVVEVGKRDDVSIGENTQRLVKLQQVLSGWLKDEFGDIHIIPGENPRLEALSDEVLFTAGPCIVWCQFRQDIRMVVKRLKADGHRVCEYHGGCSPKEKLKAMQGFQSGKYDTLVGQPDAGGRGLDLSAADAIINYSHTFKARTRAQSEERGSKVGKKSMAIIDLLVPRSTDTYIRGVVQDKVDVSSELSGKKLQKLLEKTRL